MARPDGVHARASSGYRFWIDENSLFLRVKTAASLHTPPGGAFPHLFHGSQRDTDLDVTPPPSDGDVERALTIDRWLKGEAAQKPATGAGLTDRLQAIERRMLRK
jgi:hypothetical protein